MALTQEQINKLVEEYKAFYDGEEEVTEEKVLRDLKEYMQDIVTGKRLSLPRLKKKHP